MLQVQKIESQKLELTEQEELKLKRREVQKERTYSVVRIDLVSELNGS